MYKALREDEIGGGVQTSAHSKRKWKANDRMEDQRGDVKE